MACVSGRELAIVGMGEGPFRAQTAESVLTGKRLDGDAHEVFAEAAAKVVAAVDPHSDVHASSSYRRHLAGVMAARALATALTRAGGH